MPRLNSFNLRETQDLNDSRTVVFSNFLPHSSAFSILQFLGNLLHSILDEDVPSSPICYTKYTLSLSLAELAL